MASRTITGLAMKVYDGEAWVDHVGTITPVNLALNETATQISTYDTPYVASKAVDGLTGFPSDNSLAATLSHAQPWWQVDLGAVYTISTIDVWRRTDAYPEQTRDFYVLVSDDPFTSTNLNTTLTQPGVSAYTFEFAADGPTTFFIDRTGRYVRVQLIGTGFLSIPEVQVWGTTTPAKVNVAGGMPASQSSVFSSGSVRLPSHAVNGQITGDWSLGDVAHTNSTAQPWWSADLGASHDIDAIDIVNALGARERLADFYVFVSDSPFTSGVLADALAQSRESSQMKLFTDSLFVCSTMLSCAERRWPSSLSSGKLATRMKTSSFRTTVPC